MEEREKKFHEQTFDKAVSIYREMKSIQKDASFAELITKINERGRRRTRIIRRAVAAAVALSLVAGGSWVYVSQYDRPAQAIQRLSGGVILSLPDGSEIMLGENGSGRDILDFGDVTIRKRGAGVEFINRDIAASEDRAPSLSTLAVTRGSRYDIVLEDGTHVWLNSDSQLRFPNVFSQKERRVFVEGEAYFDVSHDAARPFIVETERQTLKVFGTEFNLYAYPGGEPVCTTLVNGSVSVTAKGDDAETVLTPGQQAELSPDSPRYVVRQVNPAETSLWRDGVFAFNNNTLRAVFKKLSHCYDFEYVFEDELAAGLEVMGNIPIYDDLNSVLEVINTSGLTDITVRGRKISIRMKQ